MRLPQADLAFVCVALLIAVAAAHDGADALIQTFRPAFGWMLP